MKRIVLGIFAHVDAGKTTLSEGLLFAGGEIRKIGRVDFKDSFLDNDEIERKRGITVFSKQAVIRTDDAFITLLDTPGHADFSAEAERTLQVLDYAILVISASDGVQSHTKTLWNMLKEKNIPVFIFVNKLDLPDTDLNKNISDLSKNFGENFVDFTKDRNDEFFENVAMSSDDLMNEFLNKGSVSEDLIKKTIKTRSLFPVFGGSALKNQGVDEFFREFCKFILPKEKFAEFGAKVFKISQDTKGNRLSFMKITGGELKVKSSIDTGNGNSEKINEIRVYSGEKYELTDTAPEGTVCAVTGPKNTYAGQGLGYEKNSDTLMSQPVFNYKVILPEGQDKNDAYDKFKELEQEETLLGVKWISKTQEISITLMGEMQLEILKHTILKRFNMDVEFEEGSIIYKETILNKSEGVGHYEPLRHYAEVHLLLEPLKKGSGIVFATDCPEDELDKNWQRLILTHLEEKTHLGVLTGSPVTDIKITLKSGKAHLKHTEGGDFRQATYRAVRHGLKNAESVLLEPYYDFTLEIPSENAGRAMTDLDRMNAKFSLPEIKDGMTIIKGNVPAYTIKNYQKEILSYTKGKGKIFLKFSGYDKCLNEEEILAKIGYDFEGDVENTADSVFCSHGAGFVVKWNEVYDYMHLESIFTPKEEINVINTVTQKKSTPSTDAELLKIFERTYGKIETKLPERKMYKVPETKSQEYKPIKPTVNKKPCLLVDGYNMIFAWNSLDPEKTGGIENSRDDLVKMLATYKLFKKQEIIVVFDAYKVKGNGEKEIIDGINVVYTKEAQTADAYIEKATRELSRNFSVTVATSDALEQLIIFGGGANRMTAKNLESEINDAGKVVQEMVYRYNLNTQKDGFYNILEEKIEELSRKLNLE